MTRLQPNNLDAWSARCWVRAISPGQTQQALADCNAALKIKADAADVIDTRGFVHLKLGQNDNAIKDFDAALKIDPKLAGSLYGRGVAKARKGDRTGGSADMAAAKAIKADIAEEFARYGVRPVALHGSVRRDPLSRDCELDAEQDRQHHHGRLRLGELPGNHLAQHIGDEAEPDAGGDRIGQRHRHRRRPRRARIR